MTLLAFWLLIAIVGPILHRFGRVSPLGIVLWMIAAAMLSTWWCVPTSLGNTWVGISHILAAIGVVLSLAAGVLFLVASFRDRGRCVANCAGFMLVFFSVIIPVDAAYTMHSRRAGPEAVQETRQLILTLHQLAADIEAIRARTGRLPKDEAELVALQGKPMPAYYRDYRVNYHRIDDKGDSSADAYALGCIAADFWGENGDFFGWVVSFHGPRAVQRLVVVLF
jgi:hypothetical protein